ncbi:MAG: TlpA disulfide reductase family protein, partial [Myxococcota bacterium]
SIGECRDDLSGTGTTAGTVAANFELTDQFGDTLRLHDFCDQAVLLVGSAVWCGACKGEAPSLAAMYDDLAADGLMVITLLGETASGGTPGQSDVQAWADAYGISHPVVVDPGYGVAASFVVGGTIGLPTMTLLAPGAEIVAADRRVNQADILAVLP